MNISVIVPVYQAEKYIEKCIGSINCQSMNDYELILVDDGSSDFSPILCDEYAFADVNVVAIHKRNSGASTARNLGIEYSLFSESEWISFLDADDWIHCDYFKELFSAVLSQKTQIGMCNATRTENENYIFLDHSILASEMVLPEQLWCKDRNLCVVPWGKLFRKGLFKSLRFPEGVIQEDEVVSYQVLFSVDIISYIDTPLYVYYQAPNSVMRSNWSPKKLSGLNALEMQIDYFHKNGFEKAMRESANTYMYLIYSYIDEIKKSDKKNELVEYIFELRSRIKRGIRYYKNELRLPVKGNEWVYALAYPIEMKVYYGIRKIKRMLKR